MKLIVVGPQASGKGTQSIILSRRLHIPHISVGELMRQTTGDLKRKMEAYTTEGHLVPNEITNGLVQERLKHADCKHGFILDGYPRNLVQAHALHLMTPIDVALELVIPDAEAMRRLKDRVSCSTCGATYSLALHPPQKAGICDSCGAALVTRKDDTPEAIKRRLEIYHSVTKLVLSEYTVVRVDGDRPIPIVSAAIAEALRPFETHVS